MVEFVSRERYERDIIAAVQRSAELESALRKATAVMVTARGLLTPGMRAGTGEACGLLESGVVEANAAMRSEVLHAAVYLPLGEGEAHDVHHALSVTVQLLQQVTPGEGAALTKEAIPRLSLVAQRLDHERRHRGAVPNPNEVSG